MMVQDTVTIRIPDVVAEPITHVRTVSATPNSMNLLCAQHQLKTISFLITSFYGTGRCRQHYPHRECDPTVCISFVHNNDPRLTFVSSFCTIAENRQQNHQRNHQQCLQRYHQQYPQHYRQSEFWTTYSSWGRFVNLCPCREIPYTCGIVPRSLFDFFLMHMVGNNHQPISSSKMVQLFLSQIQQIPIEVRGIQEKWGAMVCWITNRTNSKMTMMSLSGKMARKLKQREEDCMKKLVQMANGGIGVRRITLWVKQAKQKKEKLASQNQIRDVAISGIEDHRQREKEGLEWRVMGDRDHTRQ